MASRFPAKNKKSMTHASADCTPAMFIALLRGVNYSNEASDE